MTWEMPFKSDKAKAMRLLQMRVTLRRMMTAVAIFALALWIAPVCYQSWWTWTVVRDVKRGTRRASPEGFWAAGPASVRALRETVRNGQRKTRIAAIQTLGQTSPKRAAAAHRDLAKARRTRTHRGLAGPG